MSKPQKAQILIGYCDRQGLWVRLCNDLERYQHQKAPAQSKPISDFVNRDYEKEQACGRLSPPYMLFDAPVEFGKTRLLRAIEMEYFYQGWEIVYASTPPAATAFDLVRSILQASLEKQNALEEAMGDRVSSFPHYPDTASLVSGLVTLLHQQCRSGNVQGVVFLIDDIERLPEHEVEHFLDAFLTGVQSMLKEQKIFFRLAGRDVSLLWEHKAKKRGLLFRIQRLTPFRYRYVRDTMYVQYEKQTGRSPQTDQQHQALDLCAAYVMHLTGGHPGCMMKIIEQLDLQQNIAMQDYFAQKQQEIRQDIVLPVAEAVRGAIPPELRTVLDVLSLFHRYNLQLLQRMIEQGLIAYEDGARILERQLTTKKLVRRKDDFIQDAIVSRLLVLRLQLQEPERFHQICSAAAALYKEQFQNGHYRPAALALEVLYHEIVCQFFMQEKTRQERETLRESFFAANGVLHDYMHALRTRSEDEIQNFLALVEDEEQSSDFRFCINFFFRGSEYDDTPYQQLLATIRTFIADA
jgi:hypothetical protein